MIRNRSTRVRRALAEGQLPHLRATDASDLPKRTRPTTESRMTPQAVSRDFKGVLRAARAGDESAWDAIYRWLAPEVLGFLKGSRVRDPEDVLGDVFLEVARRIGDFRGDRRGFRAWVFTIARSRRIDDIRRRARQREDRLDTGEQAVIPSRIDVEQQALGTVVLDDLMGYFDVLTDDQAEVLLLRTLGGWNSREIAEITGRTVGSVEQLHHRATRSLREILEGA